MCAAFSDLALVNDDDLVSVLDRGKTVSYHDRGSAFHHGLESILDQLLGFGINVGGCFIHYQNGRINGQSPGK